MVTGASSGLGEEFAWQLARAGYDLLLVARRLDRLQSLGDTLAAKHGCVARALQADLASAEGLRSTELAIGREAALELLVNNAGFGASLRFADLAPERAEEMIRVQVLAPTRLTRAALPGMIKLGKGAIINVSSTLAFTGSAPDTVLASRRSVYAPCKAYINTFTELLRHELEGTGVRVQALCPGLVDTEFADVAGSTPPSSVPRMPAADVVAASLTALPLDEVLCIPGVDDPALLDAAALAQLNLWRRSREGILAARYRTTPPG
jgi:short-subunit dehydrogenase